MNLITGDWIPVLFNNRVQKDVGLRELYEKSREIRDLVLNPPQRISVMRLLICITQAALDGPENEKDWLECESYIPEKSIKYLDERMDLFNLYGKKRFMQFDRLVANEWKPLDKLDFSSPSASTLFEHNASSEFVRERNDAWKAINLITLLNFHTTGKVGQSILDEVNLNHPTFPTLCIGHSHTILKGDNLLETIHLNLLTQKEVSNLPNGKWGKPAWDYFPASATDIEAIGNATRTYLGRLLPLSRLILLDQSQESTKCIIGPTPKTIEYEQLPSFREPSTTVLIGKTNNLYYLRISSERHIWRDLGSVLFLSSTSGAALTLNKTSIISGESNNKTIDVWVGGLELGEQAAKLNDMVEWNLSLPLNLLGESVLLKYQKGVEKAVVCEGVLKRAVSVYLEKFGYDKFQKDARGGFTKKSKKDWETREKILSKAALKYWQFLDNKYQVLIDTSCDDTDTKTIEGDWRNLIYDAMNHAYETACPHETPRQIQAFVIGKRNLHIGKNGKSEKQVLNTLETKGVDPE